MKQLFKSAAAFVVGRIQQDQMTALPSAIANVLHQALRYRNYPRPCPTPPSLRKEPLQPRLWFTSTASASRHALFTIAHVLWPYRVAFNCYICDTHQAHASKKIEDGEQEACSVYSPSCRRCRCCHVFSRCSDPSGVPAEPCRQEAMCGN